MDATAGRSAVAQHKALHSYGNRPMGMWSVKTRVDKATDVMGKVVPYEPSPYAASKPLVYRKAHVGKQLKTLYSGGEFGKIVYTAEAYEAEKKARKEGKRAFGTGKPYGRDDVSNMLDTLRYRHALEKELAAERKHAMASGTVELPASPLVAPPRSAGSDTFRTTAGGAGSPARAPAPFSLSARLPQVETDYDRARHVEEFTPKVPHAIKYMRDYGPAKTSAAEVGESCGDATQLRAPTYGKVEATFGDTTHLVSPSISGRRA